MPQVRHTTRARRDLIGIWLEINEVNPAAAAKLYDRLEARVEILRRFPAAGPARPDIAPEARALAELPYLILDRLVPGRRANRARPARRTADRPRGVHARPRVIRNRPVSNKVSEIKMSTQQLSPAPGPVRLFTPTPQAARRVA